MTNNLLVHPLKRRENFRKSVRISGDLAQRDRTISCEIGLHKVSILDCAELGHQLPSLVESPEDGFPVQCSELKPQLAVCRKVDRIYVHSARTKDRINGAVFTPGSETQHSPTLLHPVKDFLGDLK